MGDMNGTPQNDLNHMTNLMTKLDLKASGTHKYQGIWSYLDQFYVSQHMEGYADAKVFSPEWLLEDDTRYLGYQPKRTFVGFRYHGGYSDHLPIVLKITNK